MSFLTIVSLYIDDLLVTDNNSNLINLFNTETMEVFEMKTLGEMFYFLGMEIQQKGHEIIICQHKYAKEILIKVQNGRMQFYNNFMNQKEKFCKDDGAEKVNVLDCNKTRYSLCFEFTFKVYAFC